MIGGVSINWIFTSCHVHMPGTGVEVENGKSATFTCACVTAATMELLPVLGRPTSTTCPAPPARMLYGSTCVVLAWPWLISLRRR